MERTTTVGSAYCRREPLVAVFGRAFERGKTDFSGMSDKRSTMAKVLVSGMIYGVIGSLLQVNFLLGMPLLSANGGW